MDKPKSKSVVTAIDYSEAARWVEGKLGYPLRDTLFRRRHYSDWCMVRGEEPDSDSQEQYARYHADPDGAAAKPEYRDYWHFLVDRLNVANGCLITIGSGLLDDSLPWQQEITRAFISEFGDHVEYWCEW